MVEKGLVKLSDVVSAVFEGGDDSGHPCEQCTVCLSPVLEGTRYTTWQFRTITGHMGLEHICMDCDWTLRNLIANNKVKCSHTQSIQWRRINK